MQLTNHIQSDVNEAVLADAILIREVESALLRLFAEGRIHGTVHTCVGQEFSAMAFAGQLQSGDFVFSNHRGHGHYLAFTHDVEGLIAELMGRRTGVCAGIGSSQHLCAEGFFTNGIQGGIMPCAAGYALASVLRGKRDHVGVVYIGDGTLGEGVVYETLNLISLLHLPLLVVCEDNGVAQSTPRDTSLAGSVQARAPAFGIQTWTGSTSEPAELIAAASLAINTVRSTQTPGFFHVRTARLNSHSKGDDDRSPEHVEALRKADYLNRLAISEPAMFGRLNEQALQRIDAAIASAAGEAPLSLSEYLNFDPASQVSTGWRELHFAADDRRLVAHMQQAWNTLMAEVPELVMLGEDILSPYGGAFKVTKDLSAKYPERVFSTPISEAAICGLANGLALAGMRPVVEIMFGDFITLALDQLLNHAAKFRHIYAGKASCPMILRTPMGGGRGYGPTHSQSLEKLVTGIDTITTVAVNVLIEPGRLFRAALKSHMPVVLIENKQDYARRVGAPSLPGYVAEEDGADFPTIRLRPVGERADVTIVTYGGMTSAVVEAARLLFDTHEVLAEILVLTKIGPIDETALIESARSSGRMVTVEEGSPACGIGAEIIARTITHLPSLRTLRIGSLPVPVPSPMALESEVLPTAASITHRIALFCHE